MEELKRYTCFRDELDLVKLKVCVYYVLLPGIYSETEFMGTELCVKPYHKSGNNFYFWGVCGTGV